MLEPKDATRYERELRAMLMRAGDEDPEGFATIATLISQSYHGLTLAAALTRAQHGYSWRQLATAMGMSSSTAYDRLGDISTNGASPDDIKALIRQTVSVPA